MFKVPSQLGYNLRNTKIFSCQVKRGSSGNCVGEPLCSSRGGSEPCATCHRLPMLASSVTESIDTSAAARNTLGIQGTPGAVGSQSPTAAPKAALTIGKNRAVP